MNIAAKKIDLIDWLLHSTDESKLNEILALKDILDKKVVDYSSDKIENFNSLEEPSEPSVLKDDRGNEEFESLDDTLKAVERILKNYKSSLLEIPEEHQKELDLRLELYRKKPQDLLDWEDFKEVW
ncbi:addiction module protein [Flavobacterium sp.]|jgi:hypothetical protein|uniref:addiction module protein n=1 Tax=Flavobacterium sp. TaxID=239 RepID=UPI0022BD7AD2|nr:addiction module protein [Flavobacterium sp.]MCZ8228139.1 addiction module protein [Flavobacterium sp.]